MKSVGEVKAGLLEFSLDPSQSCPHGVSLHSFGLKLELCVTSLQGCQPHAHSQAGLPPLPWREYFAISLLSSTAFQGCHLFFVSSQRTPWITPKSLRIQLIEGESSMGGQPMCRALNTSWKNGKTSRNETVTILKKLMKWNCCYFQKIHEMKLLLFSKKSKKRTVIILQKSQRNETLIILQKKSKKRNSYYSPKKLKKRNCYYSPKKSKKWYCYYSPKKSKKRNCYYSLKKSKIISQKSQRNETVIILQKSQKNKIAVI